MLQTSIACFRLDSNVFSWVVFTYNARDIHSLHYIFCIFFFKRALAVVSLLLFDDKLIYHAVRILPFPNSCEQH